MAAAAGVGGSGAPPGVVVVLGGGIMGCATAYYFTKLASAAGPEKTKVILVERYEVGGAASGKAGGYLGGGNWAQNEQTVEICERSFQLHRALATNLGLTSHRPLGARVMQPGAATAAPEYRMPEPKGTPPPETLAATWIDGPLAGPLTVTGMGEDTAQVTPREICERLCQAALENGAELRIAAAEGFEFAAGAGGGSEEVRISGVRLAGGEVLRCDACAVTMGPWSGLAEDWFLPTGLEVSLPVAGLRSTSVVYQHPEETFRGKNPFALFCNKDADGVALEIFPRPNGEIWLSDASKQGKEPMTKKQLQHTPPEEVRADPAQVLAATKSFCAISSSLAKHAGPDTVQACIRPVLPDGLPMIGQIPGTQNAFIATGGGVWGINWGPAGGLAIAELLLYKTSRSLDLTPFAPTRFYRDHQPQEDAARESSNERLRSLNHQQRAAL